MAAAAENAHPPAADAAAELFRGASAALAEGLHPAWRELFERPALAAPLHRGLVASGEAGGARLPSLLEPFRWAPPPALRAIVLGPDRGALEAEGGLARWAPQGVLCLAVALSAAAGEGGEVAHAAHWKPFLVALLRALTGGARPPPTLLWGGAAHGLARDVQGTFWRLDASPARAAPALGSRVEWGRGETWAYCDGAASGNGHAHAQGGFGVYIQTGPLWGLELRGRVAPALYALRDASRPHLGFAPRGGPGPHPTNNRAEYLGGAWLLLLLLRGGGSAAHRLVTDSRLLVETLENWLPARRRAGTAGRLKNLDLLEILEALLAALRARGPAVWSHTRAHQRRPAGPYRRAADLQALLRWRGNRRADALATAAVAPSGTPPPLGDGVALGGGLAEARQWPLLGRWAPPP